MILTNLGIKTKQLDEIIKLSLLAVPTGSGFATRNYLGAQRFRLFLHYTGKHCFSYIFGGLSFINIASYARISSISQSASNQAFCQAHNPAYVSDRLDTYLPLACCLSVQAERKDELMVSKTTRQQPGSSAG